MIKRLLHLCWIGTLCLFANGSSKEFPADITVLPNGLTLVTIEDHREPIVSIDLWYHVGSKDERTGHAGFAHLFEHVMFEGSEHHQENFVKSMEAAGGSGINGVTNQDRTAYLETVPSSSLDYALWLEADRMGYLLGAVDQKTLDGQRAVIENERRQTEGTGYSVSARLIAENTYPPGHPYRRSIGGEAADLKTASVDDVRAWFETYYSAANAVLVLAGDITPAAAKEKVQKYFGQFPAGQPITHQAAWIAKMTGVHRQSAQDHVPRPRIYKVWNIPGFGSADSVYLDLASDCLARGKESRLFKTLVSQSKIASEVRASVLLNEIGGQFRIEATVQPNRSLEEAEKIIDQEVARFLQDGPSTEELERLKAQYTFDYYKSMERLSGLGSRSDRLAQSILFGHGAEAYLQALQQAQNATAEDLKGAAQRWLSDGVYVLTVFPFSYRDSGKQAQVVEMPAVGPVPRVKFPVISKTILPNGLRVMLTERHEVPLVNVWLSVDAGSTADPCDLPGVASMSLQLIDAGTPTRSGAEIENRLDSLGAELQGETNFDLSILKLSALKRNIAASLDLFADIAMHPTYPAAEFALEQKQALAAIQREENTPFYIALRALPELLYRPGCSSVNPFTGSGTSASIHAITREDIVRFHRAWFRPNNATLIVAGDVTLAEIQPLLEKAFADWKPGPAQAKNRLAAPGPAARRQGIYLINKPGADQAFVLAAARGIAENDPAALAAETVNAALGGNLGSRLNLNLREQKHWSYGLRSRLWAMRGPQAFLTYGAIQTDKTADAIGEIRREFADVQSTRPVEKKELADIKASEILRLPASLESLESVTEWINKMVQFGLSEDYFVSLQDRIGALTEQQVADAARDMIHPEQMLWIVVGDKSKLEPQLKQAGIESFQTVAEQRPQ